MSKVRIVGGGLTGILAALEAHHLGCRDITLHERFDTLGGEDAPLTDHGLELRDETVDFGPRQDAARRLLEWHGAAFEEHDLHYGAVNPEPCGGVTFTRGAPGPVLPGGEPIAPPTGPSLADRIRSYPEAAAGPLARYCERRAGAWLDQIHGDAAQALGVDQVHPRPVAPFTGRIATPQDGMGGLYRTCRRALHALHVSVETPSLVSPLQAFAACAEGEVIVWAADPAALFQPLRLDAPRLIPNRIVSHVFKARYEDATPFELRNFTAKGAVDRLHLYETCRQGVLAAECVADVSEDALRREIQHLMSGFGGETLTLGERLTVAMRPRRRFLGVDHLAKLAALDTRLAEACGPGFIGAWNAEDLPSRLTTIRARLAQALGQGRDAFAA